MIKRDDPNALKQLIPNEPHLKENRAFYEGDHWQDGAGWIGPMLHPGHKAYQDVFSEIRKAFTSSNRIKEGIERHTTALVGREPVFGLTPRRPMKPKEVLTPEEQTLIDEAEAELTVWWNEKSVHEHVRAAVRTLLWADRGLLRLHVPPRYLRTQRFRDGREVQTIAATKLSEALRAIWVECPPPESSTVYEDPTTKARIGIYAYRVKDGTTGVNGALVGKEFVEAVYEEGGTTYIRIFDMTPGGSGGVKEGEEPGPLTAALQMNGRITMFEMTRDTFITQQVREQQKSHNYAHTMLPRNLTTGGFLERVIFNAMPPGEWIGEGPDRYFKPDPDFQVGAGTTNFFQGTPTEDVGPDGRKREQIASPSIHWHDPVDTTPTIKAQDSTYKAILEELDQAHILIQGEAVASGKSREQARADFISSLRTTQNPGQNLIINIMESALALAEAFIKQPGKYTNTLRVYSKCRLDSGPLNAEERRETREAAQEGFISYQSAQEALGVDDIDTENALISSQPGGNLKLAENQAKVLESYLKLGFPPKVALAKAGFDPSDPDTAEITNAITAKITEEKELAKESARAKATAPGSVGPTHPNGRRKGGANNRSRIRQ